jgi:hypothetical protein
MISHEQNNIHEPEEKAALPLDQKQTTTPASLWRGWSLWLRVLGVVVPLVGGFALAFPINIPVIEGLYLLMPLLVGVVSAGLLRSWWAMLIVPVAFSVGFFLSNIFQMGGFDLQNWAASGFEGILMLVFLGVVPVAIGVAIGNPIGKKIEQRLQQ